MNELLTGPRTAVMHHRIRFKTRQCLQFLDLTDRLQRLVARSKIREGLINIQTLHTTTAILVNENEPLLLQDMRKILQTVAPENAAYGHNDFHKRTVHSPSEDKNGHSHCKAMLLRTSETLNISNGKIELGAWQRIFLLELDRARERMISVTILGIVKNYSL